MTVWQSTKRVDLADNAILVSLILGLAGLVLFYLRHASRFRSGLSSPLRLFSSVTLLCTLWDFLHPEYAALLGAIIPPVQFQAIHILSATQSGTYSTITAAIAPFAILSGILIALNGKCRPFYFLGYICVTAGMGLFSLNDYSPVRD
ncbi:hypothetical protein BDV27DRAFT_32741 [Aspergillus caelatus]|uniref:Major facilitator superfamily domain-containing protein n=1 Tax=Aspergillus caelatus TaxID=61420 RepID=A0A5N6ZTR4_9EURO|nr:uncharacterized protein BDV27DRAFT_32741 [Aspergillus caelatus]KAE8361004.1 hypothetical protein BDV27DRAFT_32741 [Aspergillus caelatus]